MKRSATNSDDGDDRSKRQSLSLEEEEEEEEMVGEVEIEEEEEQEQEEEEEEEASMEEEETAMDRKQRALQREAEEVGNEKEEVYDSPEEDEDDGDDDDEESTAVATSVAPPQTGIILSVYVENFMCHRKFSVSFNRNVNFVTGQNGAGKSAILAAIQICLGAQARTTGRGRNLKSLVRRGAVGRAPTHAVVRVTLRNEGPDAFKADTYGAAVTVERTIAVSAGYNGYKMFDAHMVEQSRSRKELEALLDQHNIQVENPVAVLDQEGAKKFIGGKPTDKYKFFMDATELARIDNTFASMEEQLGELEVVKERMDAKLEKQNEHVEALKKKVAEHQQLDQFREKLQRMRVGLVWADYYAKKEECEEAEARVAEYQSKLAQAQAKLEELQAQSSQDSDEPHQAKLNELTTEADEKMDEKKQLQENLKNLMLPQKKLDHAVKQRKKERRELEKGLATAQQRLQAVRDEILANSDKSKETEQLQEIAVLEEKMQTLKNEIPEIRQNMSTYQRKYEELELVVQDAKESVRNTERQLRGVEHKIRDLNSGSGDSMAVLGRRVRQVYQKVENAKKKNLFKGPVVGPVGHYVKMRPGKEKYAAIAEKGMGGRGMLDKFVVTCGYDRKVLQKIRETCGCQRDCGIGQIADKPRYNVPAPPASEVETITSVLNIEHDIIFNFLVDSAAADTVALCDSVQLSEQVLLYTNPNGDEGIKGHIKSVYCLPDGDQWVVRGGSKAMFTNAKQLSKTIGVDQSAVLAQVREEEQQLRNELSQRKKNETKVEHEHMKYTRLWNEAKKSTHRKQTSMDDLSAKVDAIRNDLDSSATTTLDTSDYERDVAQAQKDIENLDADVENMQKEIQDKQPDIDEVKTKMTEITARSQKIMKDIDKVREDMAKVFESKTQLESQIEKRQSKVDKVRHAIEICTEKVASLDVGVQESLHRARVATFKSNMTQSQVSAGTPVPPSEPTEPSQDDLDTVEPMEVTHGVDHYQAKIEKIKARIEKEKQRRQIGKDDPLDALEKYNRANADYDEKSQYNNELDDRIEKLKTDLKERVKKWKGMRKFLERLTRKTFRELLGCNNYSGNATFDHDTGELNVFVSKEKDKRCRNEVKALSGGERSFTTMCLLLALGERLETPFRILDEFDVFMDAPTRRLCMKLLIELAQTKMSHRQFIFITPQDLAGIPQSNTLKIHHMKPPKRREEVGGPVQQTL